MKEFNFFEKLTQEEKKYLLENSKYIEIPKDFKEVFDKLNFYKGPSLGTEFTLLMPYTYLAHYDLIMSKDGNKFLEKIGLPINLLRVSVGCENINDIINEFERINN